MTNSTLSSALHIRLLGDFHLVYGEEPVTSVSTPRLQALFTYIILHRDAPQIRQHIAFRFWPDSTEKQALTNLRHLLHDLRHSLPEADHFLRVDNKTLAWRSDAPYTLDVADFEGAVAEAEELIQHAKWAEAQQALEQATALYQGDLLPSCYDEWIASERVRLRQDYIRALARLVQLLEERRDYAAAIHYAQRLQQEDSLREASYRALMRLHALHGDRASALRVYDECVDVLEREFGVSPAEATNALYERLLGQEPLAADEDTSASPRTAEAIPLVGRHSEWKQLKSIWRSAEDGKAQLAVVTGDAGIGKTRLAEELGEWVRRQGTATASARSYASEGRLTYAPVAEWLQQNALRAHLPRLSPVWLTEVSRLLPELREDYPELPLPESIRESGQRLRLFEALARAVLASGEPLLLTFDDMQWSDSETLAWLRYLLRFAPEARLLIVGTIRTEEMPIDSALSSLLTDLLRDGTLTEIPLGPLDQSEATEVATHVAGRSLTDGQAKRLYNETEGHPLFLVEMVRAGLHAETSSTSLPPKVQVVITSRLSQLSEQARDVAQLAATIGRDFTIDVLIEASDQDEVAVVGALDELWDRHIVREQEGDRYDFSHDKLRAGAYDEVSPARRRLLHRQVAQALERVHANDLDPVTGQLAAHYEQAGQVEKAIRYYQRAGQLAREVHANEEAIRYFRIALVLLRNLPETSGRDERELELQLALGACLVALQAYGAVEAQQAYDRAHDLCERLGRPTEPPILRGMAIASLVQGDPQRAHELGEELLRLAQRGQDAVLLAEGCYVLGVTSFWMGQFASSRQHLEAAIEQYDPDQHSVHIALYAQDPKAVCLCRLARTLWFLGYSDRAATKAEEGLQLARRLEHPSSLGYVAAFTAQFYIDWGDLQKAQQCVNMLLPLAAEQHLALWKSMGRVLEGALLAEQGDLEKGIALMREAIPVYTEITGPLSVPEFQSYLARAHMKAGDLEEGLAAIEHGLAVAQETGIVHCKAELLRLKGRLFEEKGVDGEAERYLESAIDVACRQEARSLELRAAMQLAQLWHGKGNGEEAQQLIQGVYDGFTEGFETSDLKKVQSLLNAWSASAPV